MSHDFAYDVFISYASPDLVLAEEVHRRLIGAGLKVWFDKARLNPGCDWHKEIEAGCEASRIVLPVLTPRWKLSEWTKFETYGAEATIPLIFDGLFSEIITPPLTRFQWHAIELAHGEEAAWGRLISAITELLARPAPDKLARLTEVRYAANPYFVGREADLIFIHEALHENPTAVLTQGRVRAITALGGIGKTTLARQYIEKFWRCYPQIFWADCRLGVETEFARLCDLLLPEYRNETNVAQKSRFTLRELQSRSDRLLILDNAENEASIQAWIPKTGHCRTLITSRFAGWSAAVKTLHLYVLEPKPARTLLVNRAGKGEFAELTQNEQTACDALAIDLGYLPLALEQAAAYIEQQGTGFTFADYRRLYAEATASLLASGALGSTEYPDSVLTTWKTTEKKLGPGSRAILRLCAFLAPTPLPLSVLTSDVETLLAEATTVAGAPLPIPSHSEVWVREQVQQLKNYSMVEGEGRTLMLHPLVQTVQRLQLDHHLGVYRTTLERSLSWIFGAFVGDGNDVRTWPTLKPLAGHAQEVTRHADTASIADPTTRLMTRVAEFLHARSCSQDAEPLMRRALAIDEQYYGDLHPNVAVDLNNLAGLLHDRKHLAEAEPLMRRALAIDEKSFGEHHPVVAVRLNNLAMLLKSANRLAEAEPLMTRAVTIMEASLGGGDSHLATALNNLSQILKSMNRLHEAEQVMSRAITMFDTSVGKHHPRFSMALNNMAQLLQSTDRAVEAEPLMRQALAIDEQSLGRDHPSVAVKLVTLAHLLTSMGRYAEAEPLIRRALGVFECSYGEHHPDVATALNNLAQLLLAINRLAEAEPLMRRALAIDMKFYGEHHPDVARDLNNLAMLLKTTHRLTEAEPLMRRHIEILCTVNLSTTAIQHPHLIPAIENYWELLMAMQVPEGERWQKLLQAGFDPAWLPQE